MNTPGTFAENQAAINSPRSRPSSPLHTHCVSPSPFNIPSVLLYPLSVLYLILLLPIVRSVQLLVCGIPSESLMTSQAAPLLNISPPPVAEASAHLEPEAPYPAVPDHLLEVAPAIRCHILSLYQSQPSISSSRFLTFFLTWAMHTWCSTPRCSTTGL